MARSVAYLCVVLLLAGCVAGQLGFSSSFPIQPRKGYNSLDAASPCGGRDESGRSFTNTSTFPVWFTVVGNRGIPNLVTLSAALIVSPQTQKDFESVANLTIPDGDLNTHYLNGTMEMNSIKTFQLTYATGSSKFYYCFDVQYGTYDDNISGAERVAYATVLAVLAVLSAVFL